MLGPMRRLGREQWRELISEYEASNLEQKEFAAKHEVTVATLQYYLYKFRRETPIRNYESRPAFLPVEIVASPATQSRGGLIEAGVRSGVIVRFPVGTDTRYLAELLAALG
jgi:hypothetical protein